MSDSELVNGLYPKAKSDRAPDYVIGKVAINLEQFRPWVQQWQRDNPGEQWINVDMLVSKAGKPYAKLDTWKPEPKPDPAPEPEPVDLPPEDDIPF